MGALFRAALLLGMAEGLVGVVPRRGGVGLRDVVGMSATPVTRPLGGMESLFAPRLSLESCGLPPMVHVCSACLTSDGSESAVKAGLAYAVSKHALLSRRVVGDGTPEKRGPLVPVQGWRRWPGPTGTSPLNERTST